MASSWSNYFSNFCSVIFFSSHWNQHLLFGIAHSEHHCSLCVILTHYFLIFIDRENLYMFFCWLSNVQPSEAFEYSDTLSLWRLEESETRTESVSGTKLDPFTMWSFTATIIQKCQMVIYLLWLINICSGVTLVYNMECNNTVIRLNTPASLIRCGHQWCFVVEMAHATRPHTQQVLPARYYPSCVQHFLL